MTWSSTLSELRTEVREVGHYDNSATFTDAFLTRCINKAIARVHDWIIQVDPLLVMTVDSSLTTSAGVDTVSLPTTFYKAMRLDVSQGNGTYLRARRFSMSDLSRLENTNASVTGTSFWYTLQGSNILLRPTPSAATGLRLYYVPHATKLVSDGDTYTGYNGYDELVTEYALLFCDKREGRGVNERVREIERIKAEVQRALMDRDHGEASLLADNGEAGWDDQ